MQYWIFDMVELAPPSSLLSDGFHIKHSADCFTPVTSFVNGADQRKF